MRARTGMLAAVTLLLLLAIPANLGCDDILHEASYLLDDVADTLDDFADEWDDNHHHHCCDNLDDILDDIEDWFD